jgi:hypothetical protein
MISQALQSDGIQELYKIGDDENPEHDIFDEAIFNIIPSLSLNYLS